MLLAPTRTYVHAQYLMYTCPVYKYTNTVCACACIDPLMKLRGKLISIRRERSGTGVSNSERQHECWREKSREAGGGLEPHGQYDRGRG